MKKTTLFLLTLSAIALILTACPVAISYPLDSIGVNKIDKKLIGTWACDSSSDIIKVVISKGTEENSYAIEVIETGSMYSITEKKFTGYITEIDGKTFMYNRADGTTSFYTYCYELEDKNTLSLYDISLLDGGVDAVKSVQSYRDQVSSSMKKTGFLSGKETFKKQ
ncbi:MAG: hypothetical protein NT150_03280 [Bacteroidetes bacterium]|nr:hypothetical protein [Bacteroidota bacterium]